MSTQAGNQSISSKRTMALLKRLLVWLRQLSGISSHYQETVSGSGTVVSAGAGFTGEISNFVALGRFLQVSAFASGSFTPGVVTPALSFGVHGGLLLVQWQCNQNADGDVEVSMSHRFAVTPGTAYDVIFHTTAGDASVTLGHGSSSAASASTIVQDHP